MQSTQTIFQTKLSEVLYEDSCSSSKQFKMGDNNKELIDELQKHEAELFQEVIPK